VLSSEENCPGDTTWVLPLEEEGFCLSILEAEDLVVTANVEFTLLLISNLIRDEAPLRHQLTAETNLARVNLLTAEDVVVGSHDGGREDECAMVTAVYVDGDAVGGRDDF
jgi:hypothetical protein